MLLMAVLTAMSVGTSYAGYYQIGATFGSDEDTTIAPTDVPVTAGKYAPTAKDGTGTVSITTSGTIDNSLYIREGTLVLTGAGNEIKLQGNQSMTNGNGFIPLSVAGKDSTLLVDGTRLDIHSWGASLVVGGIDGSGTIVLDNKAEIDNWNGFSCFIGYPGYIGTTDVNSLGFVNMHASTATTTGSIANVADRYEGNYYQGSNGYDRLFGRGEVIVKGGSYFNMGSIGALYMAEGSLIIDEASKVEAGTKPGYNDMHISILGRMSGGTSVVEVKGESTLYIRAGLCTGYSHKTGSVITVDNSTFEVDGTTSLGYYTFDDTVTGAYTNVILKNGAEAILDTVLVSCAGNEAKVNVGTGTTLSAKSLQMYEGAEINNSGTMNVDSLGMSAGVLNNSGVLNVKAQLDMAKAATLNCMQGSSISGVMPVGCTYSFTLSEQNMTEAVTSLAAGTTYSTTAPLTITLAAGGNLSVGKYMLIDATEGTETANTRATTAAAVESVTGLGATADDIYWENGILYLNLENAITLVTPRNPLADAVQAANWGVFKSSQAFTGVLWDSHTNAAVIDATPVAGGKNGLQPAVTAQTIAWGTAYSRFSRQSSSGAFGGAEYSIYGAAIGVERQYAGGRSIGVALGYDWGRVSPFNTSRVDQDSWHVALYGRAAQWKVGQKGSIAIDWSAAAGSTTSECDQLGSDWTQDNMQLDARASYIYALTDRTYVSAFVGAQYYAQNDDSTNRVKADSLQNLRLMTGAGITHQLTGRTTVYGEVSLYNDTMRHNPGVVLDGVDCGSGANPGRLGGSATLGAQYQINSDWAVQGSYSFDVAEDTTEHNVNVGAVYSF